MLGYLPAIAAISWLTPESFWIASSTAASRMDSAQGRKDALHIARILGGRVDEIDPAHTAAGLAVNYHVARMQFLRCYHRDSWRPAISVSGLERIEHALAERRGAILWVAPFVFTHLVTKMALNQAGVKVSHLSRTVHGFSQTRFGVRVLNPIWTKVEECYLAERLVMSPDQSVAILRQLIERVRQNRVISITVGPEGRQCMAPFFAGALPIADGAPSIALKTGAPLLPVFSVRTAPGSFTTTIEAPLEVGGEKNDRVQELVTKCGRLIESYALRFPDQCRAWGQAQVQGSTQVIPGKETTSSP